MSSEGLVWTQRFPKLVASRTPGHFSAGCGGCQRDGPTGGAAYGIPRKIRTWPSLLSLPRTFPVRVFTTGALSAAEATAKATAKRTVVNRTLRWRKIIGSPPNVQG